jgi:hypothetical protein
MTTTTPLNARRMIVLSGLALLAVAASAAALPLGLSHSVSTPAGSVSADYNDYAASTCISPAVPALPALPAAPAVPLVAGERRRKRATKRQANRAGAHLPRA